MLFVCVFFFVSATPSVISLRSALCVLMVYTYHIMHVMINVRIAAQLTDFMRQVRQNLQDQEERESKKERERERTTEKRF